MSNKTKTYGVGPAAEKLNIGATVGALSVQENGKVTDFKSGDVLFDPADDAVEIKEEDGKLSDQAEGTDED